MARLTSEGRVSASELERSSGMNKSGGRKLSRGCVAILASMLDSGGRMVHRHNRVGVIRAMAGIAIRCSGGDGTLVTGLA